MRRLFCLLLTVFFLAGCARWEVPVETAVPETLATVPETTVPETEAPTEPEPVRVLLSFAGDCTLGGHTEHIYTDYGFLGTVGEDYAHPFRNVLTYFENDDFTMVNLEGTLGEGGAPAGRRYAFRGPASYTNILTQNSVEMVTLANNHTMDYGPEGYAGTKAVLDAAEMSYVEANSGTLVTLENGVTVGVYGTVYSSIDADAMVEGITRLKEQGADIVIYAPHWGVEHNFRPTQEQKDLGYAAIDAGADIVFGCHAHVLQPIEEYGDGVIYYSLGNFSFGGNIYPSDYDTAIIQQEVILDPEKGAVLGERTIIPCSLSSIEHRNNFQPTPYEPGSEAYNRTLSKLDGSYDGPNLPVS